MRTSRKWRGKKCSCLACPEMMCYVFWNGTASTVYHGAVNVDAI